jgi:hypothetical protein
MSSIRYVVLAAVAALLGGQGAAPAANYPIAGAWTVAPSNSSEIAKVQRACQAYRRKENLAERGAEGHLMVFKSDTMTKYDKDGAHVCKNVSVRPSGKKTFELVDSCPAASGRGRVRTQYKIRELNSLQVFIIPEGRSGDSYELVGCPK